MNDDAVEDDVAKSDDPVHVHLSDKYQIKYNHLLTWFLPQLRARDGNVLVPLDPGIGCITNGVKVAGQNSKLILTRSMYNVVIVLDMSASMFTVDMDHKKVIIEELDEALKMCIKPLCNPEIHPWKDDKELKLDVTLTVLAYTPQFKNRFISVLIQGYPLRSATCTDLITLLSKRCAQMHNHIKCRSDQSEWTVPERHNNNNKSDKHGLYGLIGEVLGILKLQRSSGCDETSADCSGYDNCKNVMIMITDGVIGETHQARQIVHRLHERTTSCSFIRVGPYDPGHYGFGYIPNISLLKFIAEASGGQYWNWCKKHAIKVESVFQWSLFRESPDTKGLISKTDESPTPIQASLISTITKKIFEGFKICDVNIRSLAPDFSGTEITTLGVTMSLTWRKRIHVTYELVTDLPIEPYSAQKMPKVKVTVCSYGDYEVINGRCGEEDKHRTHVKLLDHFKRFVVDLLKPHQDDAEKRWIFDLHNYAYSSISKLSIAQASQKPYKIERRESATNDQEMNRLNKFWLHLMNEKEFIDAHFDVYQLKCWLQFDLNLPKCLTGISRSYKNHNKEFQIYSRSHGFLLDVLVKWCKALTKGGKGGILIEKDIYIKLYETKTGTDPKNSFVWVTVSLTSCASMSIYIAMHRDIPFIEQQELRKDLVDQLMGVKFQGSLLLDSSIKVGLDTTLKKRGGNFIPFNLKAEYACQQMPKNIDDMISGTLGPKRGDLYLHKLVCHWKTCPDVHCCSDDLIKELRNEIFNALFRLRLQEEFRPLSVGGKVFSCFRMLNMNLTTSSDKETTEEVTCLLQYVITVDDDCMAAEKRDQRKISSDFTTEILIEPQWGKSSIKSGNLTYLDGLEFQKIPPQLYDMDFKLISSLCTFATIKKLCSQPDKHQPEFSNQFCPKPTSFKEPVSTPDLPYLFLVSNLLSRSHLNVLNFPLLSVLPVVNHELNPPVDPAFSTTSPNTYLLRCLSELLEVSFSRSIELSQDELDLIQKSVLSRKPVGEKVCFSEKIPDMQWKCFVRFHKTKKNEPTYDKTRLQFVMLPEPPEDLTETQLADWFPGGRIDVLVFDCLYKILLGTFTNPQRCSLEKLYACDNYIDKTDEIEEVPCPDLITQIIEESTSTHTPQSLEKALKFKHIGEICKAYEKCYVLGVHQAIISDIPLEKSCVDAAMLLLEKPRLDLHVKKERRHIPLVSYMSAVCSHVSGQLSCCHNPLEVQETLNQSMDSSDRDATSESYNADIEITQDSRLVEDDNTSANFTLPDSGSLESEEEEEEEEDSLSTPCQNEAQWTRVVSSGLPVGSHNVPSDAYCAEIVSASSAELTPIIADKKFADTVRAVSSHCHEENADIDEDSYSGSSSDNNGQRPGALPPVGETPSSEGDNPQNDEDSEPQFQITDTGMSPAADVPSELKKTNGVVPEDVPLEMPSLHVGAGQTEDPLIEKRVSFIESRTFSEGSEQNNRPIINIIASTPQLPRYDGRSLIAVEEHRSIQAKFDEIIDSRFIRISQYSSHFLVMKADNPDNMDSFTTERQPVLFMKMSCEQRMNDKTIPITTIPTCVLEVAGSTEKRKLDIDLWFDCYTLPVVVHSSPIYRSPTHSFINSRPRRKESYKKSDHSNKGSERKGGLAGSAPIESSFSAHQVMLSNPDDTDDGGNDFPVSNKSYVRSNRFRDKMMITSVSSPNLGRQMALSDPIIRRSILEDMYEDVKWLIEDQFITHLRRKSPVSLDILKQVLDHCKRAPETAQNCCLHTEDMCYVETWVVKDERSRSEGDKQRQGEKVRHDELLAKIQLAWESESFSLCRIDNFFFYSLDEENEERDNVSGRDILSAQSSISSMGSAPSHNRSSSSSFPDEIPLSTESTMKPCSKFWIVIQVTYTHFQVAFQTADTGEDNLINQALLNKIISTIVHLNKTQNQEFLLHEIVESKLCPKELLYNHTPLPHGDGYNNTYVCDVVHTIEVQLWDKDEHEGLRDIKESLFNIKCDNLDEFVYFYRQDAGTDTRSTFYFQLPEAKSKPGDKSKTKKLYIDVRGLQPPDPEKQSSFDRFVQQKLEEAKLEDIAHRLNRNSQAKLTAEEVSFLSNKNSKSYRTLYIKIPPYVYDFLPHFWFYLDQHLVQQQDLHLFCPRYDSNNDKRIQFCNEKTGEIENTRDHEVFIKLLIGNRARAGHHDGRYAARSHCMHKDPLFQSLLLVNITIVGPDNQPVDFNKRWFSHKSPVFEQGGYEPPSARRNEEIKHTSKLDEKTRLSLKLRIIEKRKKAGSNQKSEFKSEIESALYQAVQAAYISLLLEVYILPVELTIRKASPIVACLDEDLSVTPKQTSSSLGGKSGGGLLSMMKGRRGSQEGMDRDTLKELESRDTGVSTQRRFLRTWSLPPELSEMSSQSTRHSSETSITTHSTSRSDLTRSSSSEHPGHGQRMRRKMPTSSSKDENCSLHPNLREPCFQACKVGAQLKTKIVDHHFMQIPSLFVSSQVINKIIDGLSGNFKVRIFGQDADYKMIPPTCHTEDEIENNGIVLVARRPSLWNESRVKLHHGSDLMVNDERPNIEQILSLETGTIDVRQGDEKLEVPRQMHILVTLNCKKLNFYFYNVHKQVKEPFIASIKRLVSWLNTRKMVLNRLLLLKARHEIPPHYAQSELLPQNEDELEQLVEQKEPSPDHHAADKQQSTFKNKGLTEYYEHLYDHYHPGVLAVEGDKGVQSRDPLRRHARQLGLYMRAALQKKEEEENKVDLDDPDLPNNISCEQAKLLKKNARLMHYIASPLLFSSKLKSSETDKETFSYVSKTTNDITLEEPAWFLHFKNQLFDKFIAHLRDPARGINMSLKYEPSRGLNKDVEVSNTLNNDDNEALLCKETVGGGRILLGVLIQNSTFCVKLYGFDSDNRLRLFQECNNLKAHTHTNSFNYDWMVQSIYESLVAHQKDMRVNQRLPVHYCVQSVVKHYETVPEPPHIRCWMKHFTDFTYSTPSINPDSLHAYIVQNQESFGLFTIPSESSPGDKRPEESKLLVLIPQDLQDDFQNNLRLAIIVSELTLSKTSAWEFGMSYYVILHYPFNSSPSSTIMRDPYLRSRNESLTELSVASSAGSEDGLSLFDTRSRVNSQFFNALNAKQELYNKEKLRAEEYLRDLLQRSVKSYHRDGLIRKLLRPLGSKNTISLELSYSSNVFKDEFTFRNLKELMNGDLSFNKNLLEERSSIYKLLQDWTDLRFKKLLEFLKGKVDMSIILDDESSDKGEIGLLTKRTLVAGKPEKISLVVMKRTKFFNLDIFAVLKDQDECRDIDHVQFWERILSLICVFVWERLINTP